LEARGPLGGAYKVNESEKGNWSLHEKFGGKRLARTRGIFLEVILGTWGNIRNQNVVEEKNLRTG